MVVHPKRKDASTETAVVSVFQLPCGSVSGRTVKLKLTWLWWSLQKNLVVCCTPFALALSLLPVPSPDGEVHEVRKEKGSRRTCANASARQYRLGTCQVKALITSACLKHSDFLKIDNWIEPSPTAVHMKPLSMRARVRQLG